MARVRLIHWKAAEADERIEALEACGHSVEYDEIDGGKSLNLIKDDPPDAIVIDLSRLPSHGRDVGNAMRQMKPTRHVPLVFVDGAAEKVEKVKQLLPDAIYCSWSKIAKGVQRALDKPAGKPVVPSDNLAGYSGTPLPKKLGIKAGTVVSLVSAPEHFVELLGELPEGAKLKSQLVGKVT